MDGADLSSKPSECGRNMRHFLARVNWFLSEQMGIDLRKMLFFVLRLPRFMYEYMKFRSLSGENVRFRPCLHDRGNEGGEAKGEYFLQDLLVARCIFAKNPVRHIDIGSRVSGFVAHVASFRAIEVFDVRPNGAKVPGIEFRQTDMMFNKTSVERCDSLSCLHALEHFGLGRYGDPINPGGVREGFGVMADMVQAGGRFYLSVPIGRPRVEFNAHRVIDPREVMDLATKYKFQLVELIVLQGGSQETFRHLSPERLRTLADLDYSLGIFIFDKQGFL